MSELWPWLAMAGLGALHGLNPATGWMLAAAWGLRSRDRSQALRALWPIGLGHVASVALVAVLLMAGLSVDRTLLQCAVGALLLISAAVHLWRRAPGRVRAPAGQLGLALWSFLMSSLHGAGLMLVPALVPLCMTDAATASWPLLLALAAVGVHSAAMLLVTGLVALGLCRGFDFCARIALVRRIPWRNNCFVNPGFPPGRSYRPPHTPYRFEDMRRDVLGATFAMDRKRPPQHLASRA